MIQNKTLQYYNNNASCFVTNTLSVDFQYTQNKFMQHIKPGALILDFGCGSGRDIKYFIVQGCQVEAIDGSEELCKIASEYSGVNVKHMYFHELTEHEKYDNMGLFIYTSLTLYRIEESNVENSRGVKKQWYFLYVI